MEVKTWSASIFTIDNFLSAKECEDFIALSEQLGYEKAKIDTDKGQKVVAEVRNNRRLLYSNTELAEKLWTKLRNYAPARLGNSIAIGLNELFRFYKYEAGQAFKKHRDQSFIRNESEASYFTFMVYLNEDFEGGETKFNTLSINAEKGTALIFLHDLEHEGSELKSGVKYVLRSDIMYRLAEDSE